MSRNLIVGDIHSEYDKLVTVQDKASFDPESDILYSLGDFCDRGRDALKTLVSIVLVASWVYLLKSICKQILMGAC